jgi:hypothetical protein
MRAATNLFKLMLKYRPEDKKEKKACALKQKKTPTHTRERIRAASHLPRTRPPAALQERLLKKAEAEKDGKPTESKKPIVVKYGINHITYLVEQARFCADCCCTRATRPSGFAVCAHAAAPPRHPSARVCRARRSWLSLRTTWTRSSWSSGCPRCAAR